MTTKSKYIIGSVSSGTMRPEDLIPCFLDTLEELDSGRAQTVRVNYAETIAKVGKDDLTDDEQFEVATFLNETLFALLDTYAPSYFYFGAHPGDGSDYGFWLHEDWEQIFLDYGGLKVNDTSEVPQDYAGEVLYVNDHGNLTLYAKDAGSTELREIWALV